VFVVCYQTVVLVCISLITYDVDHLPKCYWPFVYLLAEISVHVLCLLIRLLN
jgi:hypothetical protein